MASATFLEKEFGTVFPVHRLDSDDWHRHHGTQSPRANTRATFRDRQVKKVYKAVARGRLKRVAIEKAGKATQFTIRP